MNKNSLKMSPKSTRNIKLMNTVAEVCEDRLNVFQYSNVIISSAVSIVVLQFVYHLKENVISVPAKATIMFKVLLGYLTLH